MRSGIGFLTQEYKGQIQATPAGECFGGLQQWKKEGKGETVEMQF